MFFAIPNISSHKASVVVPWDFEPRVPAAAQRTKAKFKAWYRLPTTQHCHYSAFEGSDALTRVDTSNPPVFIHGIVTDYDTFVDEHSIEAIHERTEPELMPNWASKTHSNGARLIWLFETPLSLPDTAFTKEFLKIVKAKLGLTKLLPGFDEPAYTQPTKYYEVGVDWELFKEETLPETLIQAWAHEAGTKVDWEGQTGIPFEDLSAELDKKYPGVWPGGFSLGARGPSFWVPGGINPTAAIVRETGIQSFSCHPGFVTWETLFGKRFVSKYTEAKSGQVITETLYDGSDYWRRREDGKWMRHSREDFRMLLKVKYGFSSTAGRKETSSEVDRVMVDIHERRRVECALPFVHFPRGIMEYDGKTFLNTSTATPIPPAPEDVVKWGDGFPWLGDFLIKFFDPHDQFDFFLAWLKHFYEGAYFERPRLGQSVFLAGDVGMGKTLLSTGVVSRLVGGFADASSYLLGNERFTGHIIEKPVMSVDDTSPATDKEHHAKYSAMIKKIAANRHQQFEEKFRKAGQVIWLGRVFVTCNADPESIKLLPNMELSLMDKIMLFKAAHIPKKFPPDQVLEDLLTEELPYFARWLLNWEMPAHCVGDSRFGVEAKHEKSMFQTAIHSGSSAAFLELLKMFLENYELGLDKDASGTTEVWVGTTTKLISDMLADESIRPMVQKYSPTGVSTILGQLKARGYPFNRVRDKKRNRAWEIPFIIEEPGDADVDENDG